jgi:hypothetical protein
VRDRKRLTITNHHPFITRIYSRNIDTLRIICRVRSGARVRIPGRVGGGRGGRSSESLNKIGRLLFLEIKKCPAAFSQVYLLVTELAIDWREIRFCDRGRWRFGLSSINAFRDDICKRR